MIHKVLNTPFISVIVPLKNMEKYLEKCLRSIMQQTYRNLEIIVIDDGSTDKSLGICRNLAKEDQRFQIIHNETSVGVSRARNIGLEAARGEWIAFVDADDWIDKTAYQKVVEKTLDNVDVVFWSFSKDYPDGQSLRYSETTLPLLAKDPFKVQYTLKQTYIIKDKDAIITDNVFSGVWRTLFKKSIIKNHFLKFDERLRYSEDKLFITQYLSCCRQGLMIDESFYHYRQNVPQSATATIIDETFGLCWLNNFLPTICGSIKNNNFLSDEEKRDLIYYMHDRFVFRALIQQTGKEFKKYRHDDLVRKTIRSWNKKELLLSGLDKNNIRTRLMIKHKLWWIVCLYRRLKKRK